MNSEIPVPNESEWTCMKCGSGSQIAAGTTYYRCLTCGELFKFFWRGRQLDGQETKTLSVEYLDQNHTAEEMQETVSIARTQLRILNDQTRQMEMSKGSERLRILALFLLICSMIYSIFLITVSGISALLKPDELSFATIIATGISLLVLIFYQVRKGSVVHKVNILLSERAALETRLESAEAVLFLEFGVNESLMYENNSSPDKHTTTQSTDESDADILGKYADVRRRRRTRLNLRDTEE